MLSKAHTSKAEYGEFESKLALFSNALGHPSRIAIIFEILSKNNLVEGEYIRIDGLSKSQVQKHLSELHKTGLISGRIHGVKRSYAVNLDAIAELSFLFAQLKNKLLVPKIK